MGDPTPADGPTVLIVNPQSGSSDHESAIRARADLLGLCVRRSERQGHAVDLAAEAIADGAGTLVAVGGDGTVNEVIRGVIAADALEEVDVGVIPAGTGNSFARNIGVPDLETAFEVLQHGERRRIDVGMANGFPFLNSCIAGLTAEASDRTDDALKARIGVAAYVFTTIRTWSAYDAIGLRVEVHGGDTAWTGPVGLVLVGNARRVAVTGDGQADVEDGRFDVSIIEDPALVDLDGGRALDRLGELWPALTRLQASGLDIDVESGDPVRFSLDGEIREFDTVTLRTLPRALRVAVGEAYEPTGTG